MALEIGGSQFEMIAISILVMVTSISLIYMLAQIFRKSELEAFATLETYQVFFSVVLLLMTYFLANMAIGVSMSIFGVDYFEIALKYLDIMISQLTIPTLVQMEGLVILFEWMGGAALHFGAGGGWSIRFQPLSFLSLLASIFEWVVFVISPFASSLVAQSIGLQLIKATTLTLVLPAGIILRIFPPTRDAGVLLIAASFGFYFVFPLTYVMHYNIMRYIDARDGVIDFLPPPAGQDPRQETIAPYDWISDYRQSIQENQDGEYHQRITERVLWNYELVMKLFVKLSVILMQGIFLPGLSMLITMTFIKSMNKFLSQKMG
ncbi:MAG: hypothetical protein QXW70_01560 [Candidatus Anstonellales archaeon]